MSSQCPAWQGKLREYHVSHLPWWISRWVGYRKTPPSPPQYAVWFWSWIGAFSGLVAIQAIFGQAQYFLDKGVPTIVASYAASAVLIYGAIDAALAQPRCLFGGHFVGALIGVAITKLFLLLPSEERYEELAWLSGSIACATAIVVMQITGTTHPPGGATAFLASTSPEIRKIGWYYIPVILLTSSVALVIALLTNNIQRKYPVYWFIPPRQQLILPMTEKDLREANASKDSLAMASQLTTVTEGAGPK
ncbi:hypothetical protein AAF712_005792 [Marasmius tenuissimus]|uniref:HPP transmembrane region domain-containing protein n=1 Tax=Marasmius tenuissimus TaxID=585030 RepID=A0ABR3A1K8_9AGAR